MIRPRGAIVAAVVALAFSACGKSEATRRAEIQNCSAITLDGAGITRCLVEQFRWKPEAAGVAGRARQRELDSLAARQHDSVWTVAARQHRQDLDACQSRGGDVGRCLSEQYAWDPAHANASFDSVWHSDARKHQQEVAACRRQGKSSAGSCLMLYYKWDPKHALALDDSLARARMRALQTGGHER